MADDGLKQLLEDRDDDSPLIRDLRSQLRESNKQVRQQEAELGELRPLRTETVLRDLGMDPKSKQAKALLRLHGDGEQTAEALRATAEDYDIALPDPDATADTEQVDEVAQQRTEATQRIDELRASATPVGTQRTSWDEYKAMQATNPGEAAKLLQAGKVDTPPHIASALAVNRADRANQIGAPAS